MQEHGTNSATGRRGLRRSRRPYPASVGAIVLLFSASGMTGGNCVMRAPDTDAGAPVIEEDDHILGSPDSKVTVVSYECFQ